MTTRIGDNTRARILEHWPKILDALAAGRTCKAVLADIEVSASALRMWRAEDPVRKSQWEEAREQSADSLFDEALDIARNPHQVITDPAVNEGKPLIIPLDPPYARNLIDSLKWAARIRNPRLYGDRATVDLNVRTVDLTRIIQDANARLIAARRPLMLEATITRLTDIL